MAPAAGIGRLTERKPGAPEDRPRPKWGSPATWCPAELCGASASTAASGEIHPWTVWLATCQQSALDGQVNSPTLQDRQSSGNATCREQPPGKRVGNHVLG